MAKAPPPPPPQVKLGEPEPIKIYLENETVDYLPADHTFQLDRATGVALVTFNTPEALNSLQSVSLQEMLFILEHIKQCPDVRAVVWTGAGRAFSAGAALKPRKGKKVKFPPAWGRVYKKKGMWMAINDIALKAVTLAFWDCPKVSVVAVNGMAVGGATNIALANFHDYVVLADNAKFKYPFTKLGVTPELGSSLLLPYLVGMARAKHLLMSDEWFSAEEALQMGLANKIVPLDSLVEEALKVAAKYATNPNQLCIMEGKRLVNSHLRERMDKVMDEENRVFRKCIASGGPMAGKLGGGSKL